MGFGVSSDALHVGAHVDRCAVHRVGGMTSWSATAIEEPAKVRCQLIDG